LLQCTPSLNLNISTVKIALYLFIIKGMIVICKLISGGPFLIGDDERAPSPSPAGTGGSLNQRGDTTSGHRSIGSATVTLAAMSIGADSLQSEERPGGGSVLALVPASHRLLFLRHDQPNIGRKINQQR
jgi:hypothetical protein